MSVALYWLEQHLRDVPPADDWLGPSEISRLAALRIAKRRSDWRLGRWTAKTAAALLLRRPLHPRALASLEIRPAVSGAPEVFLDGRPAPLSLSLSHRDGSSACVVCRGAIALGCDVELVELHSSAFIADYFTASERGLVASTPAIQRPALVTLLWCAKESALKALHEGLRRDTRSVEALIDMDEASGAAWQPLRVHCDQSAGFHGWWKRAGQFVFTVAASKPCSSPIDLVVPRLAAPAKASA